MSDNFLNIKDLRKLIQEVIDEIENTIINEEVFYIDDDGNVIYGKEDPLD